MISMDGVPAGLPTVDPVTISFMLTAHDERPVWTMTRKLKNSHVI